MSTHFTTSWDYSSQNQPGLPPPLLLNLVENSSVLVSKSVANFHFLVCTGVRVDAGAGPHTPLETMGIHPENSPPSRKRSEYTHVVPTASRMMSKRFASHRSHNQLQSDKIHTRFTLGASGPNHTACAKLYSNWMRHTGFTPVA